MPEHVSDVYQTKIQKQDRARTKTSAAAERLNISIATNRTRIKK